MFAHASRWPLRGVETGIGNWLIFQMMTSIMSYRIWRLLRSCYCTKLSVALPEQLRRYLLAKKTRVAHGEITKAAVNPTVRIQEYPEQYLKGDGGKLVCTACHTEVSLKKSIFAAHVKTDRHKLGKERVEKEQNRQGLVRESFRNYQDRRNKNSLGLD